MTVAAAPRPRLVVVGNGMAAMRAVERLLATAPEAWDITVFGGEPHGSYDRIALSPLLAGDKVLDDIVTHPPDWYVARGIRLHLNEFVVDIDRAARTVTSARGRVVGYDRLLIATGSRPFVPPIPGAELDGVVRFRALADVNRMLAAGRRPCRAAVIGGGVLGLEAAAALARRGMDVTVVHRGAWPMDRQLDAEAGHLLQHSLEGRGIRFALAARTQAVLGTRQVEGLAFEDGSRLAADLVVLSAGIVPETRLAQAAGLACGRGILVDDTLTTSDPAVLSIGECIEHRGICYGLVAPAYEQAAVVAARLADPACGDTYGGSVTSLKLKVTGIDLFSAGDFADGDRREVMQLRDARRGLYRRLVVQDQRLIGAVVVGEGADTGWYFDLIQRGEDISALRAALPFGRAWADAA